MPNKIQRGVSKAEWLAAGLKALSEHGVASLTILYSGFAIAVLIAGYAWAINYEKK